MWLLLAAPQDPRPLQSLQPYPVFFTPASQGKVGGCLRLSYHMRVCYLPLPRYAMPPSHIISKMRVQSCELATVFIVSLCLPFAAQFSSPAAVRASSPSPHKLHRPQASASVGERLGGRMSMPTTTKTERWPSQSKCCSKSSRGSKTRRLQRTSSADQKTQQRNQRKRACCTRRLR